jgi:hypothetical protein
MKVALAPSFVRHYRSLAPSEQATCDECIDALPGSFGHPHRHAGLGIRSLRRNVYEFRVGRSLRVGFVRHGETLLLQTVGNHDTIRAWLKNSL